MDRFFRGIGDRIRGTNSEEERAAATSETLDDPDVTARASSTGDGQSAEPLDEAGSKDALSDTDSVDAAAASDDASDGAEEESDGTDEEDEDSDSGTTDSDAVDGDDSTTLTGGVISEGPGTVTVSEGASGNITVSDGSDSGYEDTSGLATDAEEDSERDSEAGVEADSNQTDEDPESDSEVGVEADPYQTDVVEVPEQTAEVEVPDDSVVGDGVINVDDVSSDGGMPDTRVPVPGNLGDVTVNRFASFTDDDDDETEVPKDYLIEKPNVELQRDPSLYPENPQPKAGEVLDVMGSPAVMTAEYFPSSTQGVSTDFFPSSTEGTSSDIATAQFGEMDGLWGARSEEPGIGGGQIAGSAEMSATAAGFTMAEQPQESGFMAGGMKMEAEVPKILDDDVGLLRGEQIQAEPLSSMPGGLRTEIEGTKILNDDIGALGGKGDASGPMETMGFAGNEDDLWREGSGEKLEFMTDMSSEIDMEVFFNHSLKAEAGESGQDTGAGWDPTPAGSYAVVDPSSVGKESGEPEPVVVEGTAVAASDLEFTMPAASADESGGKESGLDGILTPVPEPDYSLGPAPMPPDPIDKDNYFDDTHKDVGLLDAQPMEMDPTAQTQYGDSNEWFEEQYQESGGDSGGDSGDGDDDDIPG